MTSFQINRGVTAIGLAICLALVSGSPAWADINLPISGAAAGSDGVFAPTESIEVDLSQAVTGTWDMTSPDPGNGVYDPEQWMVVFKYSSVSIPAGVTVTFKNHPTRAPVVWLVSGDKGIDPDAGNVTIAGTVDLNGENGVASSVGLLAAEPGPGGFRGGRPSLLAPGQLEGSASFGPGGGSYQSSGDVHGPGGSYGEQGSGFASLLGPTYGNVNVLPLIGGSGGSGGRRTGNNSTGGGGGGGGALLIAATSEIGVLGALRANGGVGGDPPGTRLCLKMPFSYTCRGWPT